MLLQKLRQAKKNLGITDASNFEDTIYESEKKKTKEEVIIGHNYIDDNAEYDDRLDMEDFIKKDPESPNDLDPDSDVISEGDLENPEDTDKLIDREFTTDITAEPKFLDATYTGEPAIFGCTTTEEIEESMDQLNMLKNLGKLEDTSGKTFSNVDHFLEKYVDGNDIIQVLRTDLMKVLSDIQWITESNNQHEQWALDFADALNELSVRI